MSVGIILYHSIFLSSFLYKITNMLHSFFGIIFTYVIRPTPHTPTTSSFFKFLTFSSALFVITLIPAPDFTKLDTSKVTSKLFCSLAAQFLAQLSPVITILFFFLVMLFALCIFFWCFFLKMLGYLALLSDVEILGDSRS
jgi:hypothetical protein